MHIKKEIWKDIVNYEGIYQVSNFGRIRSLDRLKKHYKGTMYKIKGRILKQNPEGGGYLSVSLYKNGIMTSRKIHQLIAESFLNHKPNGNILVVNHKDHNIKNNNLSNLEIITNRENSNHSHRKSSSKYVGVYWASHAGKWRSEIRIKCKRNHLGYFNNEMDAAKAYNDKLKELKEVL